MLVWLLDAQALVSHKSHYGSYANHTVAVVCSVFPEDFCAILNGQCGAFELPRLQRGQDFGSSVRPLTNTVLIRRD